MEQIIHIYPNNLDINSRELVICLNEIISSDLNEYKRLYDNNVSIDYIGKMIFMHNYFNCSTYYPTNIELSNIMLNIKDSSYWKYSYNCNITITPQFESRMFIQRQICSVFPSITSIYIQ